MLHSRSLNYNYNWVRVNWCVICANINVLMFVIILRHLHLKQLDMKCRISFNKHGII